jgi:lipopolysaccharide transport system ATP-binding protein
MIAGTTQPTCGDMRVTGHVAALLELGIGFHPDFTGRQNAHLAGQLLGYRTDEISRFMPAIEAFAEIGDYIDQPVRVYSSGMQVRLAFAVATVRRPDVLIIDEALSVGDAYFQHKSFDRIRALRKQGTTLIIVSHDKEAIQSICDRALLLDAGKLVMEGSPEAVLDYYNARLHGHDDSNIRQEVAANIRIGTVSGTGEAEITDAALLDEAGRRLEVVSVGQRISLYVAIRCYATLPDLVVGFMIKNRLGQAVFGTNTDYLNIPLDSMRSGKKLELTFNFEANLGPGTYSMALALQSDGQGGLTYEWKDIALLFDVVNTDCERFVGVARLPVDVRVVT